MNLDQHRHHQDRVVTAVVAAVCGLGFAGAISPIVEHTFTHTLLALAGLGVLALAGRWVARRLRERREDHADTRAAIAWRAEHLPADHPLVLRDKGDRGDCERLGRDRLDRAA